MTSAFGAAPMATETPVAAAPPATRRARFHTLRVNEIVELTDDAVSIGFEVPPELAPDYDFVQGQHVTVRTSLAGDDVRRSYSICAPAGSRTLRIGVKVLPGGHFSAFAAGGLAVGDELEVMTPAGRFNTPLDPANAKHYCAIAAGSGITPILSIVATTLAREPRSRVTLLFANRTSRSIMFLEELEDLKDRYGERFHLIHVLTREAQDAELLSGRLDRDRITRITRTLVPADTVDEWFLCGPFAMVMELRDALVDVGVDSSHVHSELFHAETTAPVREATVADSGEGALVTVNLDGRRSSFRLSGSGLSVLEAALQVRADAPYACKGGVCGTCRAKVVEGAVAMDTNYALEPEEMAAGYVLTCQSHPTTETVSLDFDA